MKNDLLLYVYDKINLIHVYIKWIEICNVLNLIIFFIKVQMTFRLYEIQHYINIQWLIRCLILFFVRKYYQGCQVKPFSMNSDPKYNIFS